VRDRGRRALRRAPEPALRPRRPARRGSPRSCSPAP
jgi:hypothetical protein